jgi:hypothetical protein
MPPPASPLHALMTDDTEEWRVRTLRTLIELASDSNASGCWGDDRAEDLLRSQSSPDEVRAMGMSDAMIARIWSRHAG